MISSKFALEWHNLQATLTFSSFNQSIDFFDFQPRVCSAVNYFLANPLRNLLVLKSNDLAQNIANLAQWIQKQQGEVQLKGVRYFIEQGEFAQIYAEPAQYMEDNFAAKKTVISALYCDQHQLFGVVRSNAQSIQLEAGLVHQINGGVLILSIANLLEQFDLWSRLKTILQTGQFQWRSASPLKPLPCHIPAYPLQFKLILLGDRNELASFAELEPELYPWADYAELDYFALMETDKQQQLWGNWVVQLAKQLGLDIDHEGVIKLYQYLVRETEDRGLAPISSNQLESILQGASKLADKSALSAVEINEFFVQRDERQSFLREATYREILNEQIYVATEGEMVGQVNGLSVIEYEGTPLIFGEPSRISCVVQFGEGELMDIDRKNELAGNVHSKGMMIAEACLANLMNFQSQRPFSASLVFEQSYTEIDGDSASLAIFCVLVSALADLPLPQSIAITGTIDQFGLVHSVSGVNHKVEGFFTLCERRGLTGKQAVIMPSTVINQLSLSDQVVSAVKDKMFYLYAVDDVFQACEILFQRDFMPVEGKYYSVKEQPIVELIEQRIAQKSEQFERANIWQKLSRMFLGMKLR